MLVYESEGANCSFMWSISKQTLACLARCREITVLFANISTSPPNSVLFTQPSPGKNKRFSLQHSVKRFSKLLSTTYMLLHVIFHWTACKLPRQRATKKFPLNFSLDSLQAKKTFETQNWKPGFIKLSAVCVCVCACVRVCVLQLLYATLRYYSIYMHKQNNKQNLVTCKKNSMSKLMKNAYT